MPFVARVYVTRQLPGRALDRLRGAHDVEVWPDRLPPPYETLRAKAATADALLVLLTERIDKQLLESSPQLKAIANYAVGTDNIDLEAATAHGIPVGNTPDVLTDATADLTFALLLAAARNIPQALAAVSSGDWVTWEPGEHLGRDVHGATLGIVGRGRIGEAVASRARGFEMDVIYTHTSPSTRDRGLPLHDLLQQADFVTIHAPLTPATHHLIDARALASMKPTAILINTARGPIIDQEALRHALATNAIAGAALDVTDPEPLPPGDPLLTAPNVLITPHIGSATQTARERMADLAVDNLLAALDGKPMPHQANAERA
jgi:glyoxylate reductase